MIVVMKPNFTQEQMHAAIRVMEAGGVKVMVSKGSEVTILGAEGNAARLSECPPRCLSSAKYPHLRRQSPLRNCHTRLHSRHEGPVFPPHAHSAA